MVALVFSVLLSGIDPQGPSVLSPCIDEVTVRAEASVQSARLGVLARGDAVWLQRVGAVDSLTLTIDRNVPAPLTVTLRDSWLLVRTTERELSGWVFGGLMCRPSLTPSARWISLVGRSPDERIVAFVERAPDSGACGFGAPATLRIVDTRRGVELATLHDGCPPADLLLSHRAEVEALLAKHGVVMSWAWTMDPPGALEARVTCEKRACRVQVVEGQKLRAEVGIDAKPGQAEGLPTVSVKALVRTAAGQVAFVRVLRSDSDHRFVSLLLK